MSNISKDGRFKIERRTGGSDHWMDTSIDWVLKDTHTGKKVCFFSGDHMVADSIHSVKFSSDGNKVIAKDEKGKILKRVNLIKLAEQLDRKKTEAKSKAKKK